MQGEGKFSHDRTWLLYLHIYLPLIIRCNVIIAQSLEVIICIRIKNGQMDLIHVVLKFFVITIHDTVIYLFIIFGLTV